MIEATCVALPLRSGNDALALEQMMLTDADDGGSLISCAAAIRRKRGFLEVSTVLRSLLLMLASNLMRLVGAHMHAGAAVPDNYANARMRMLRSFYRDRRHTTIRYRNIDRIAQ